MLGEARCEHTKDEDRLEALLTEKRKKKYKESHLRLLTLASQNKRVTHKVKDLRKTLKKLNNRYRYRRFFPGGTQRRFPGLHTRVGVPPISSEFCRAACPRCVAAYPLLPPWRERSPEMAATGHLAWPGPNASRAFEMFQGETETLVGGADSLSVSARCTWCE